MTNEPRKIQVLVLNGPNINLLGTREPATYGYETLEDVIAKVAKHAEAMSAESSSASSALAAVTGGSVQIKVEAFQHNSEGEIVTRIHSCRMDGTHALIVNAGAYTHTSVAIRDALIGIDRPFVEVHISNVHAREPFRHHSYLSDKASGIIVGLGTFGYVAALEHCVRNLCKAQKSAV